MIYNESKYNSQWDTKKLNELGTFDRGKSRHRPRDDKRLFENGKYPLIQTGEVKAANLYITSHNAEYSEFGLAQSKLWPKGTLCITIAANIAETALLGYDMCFPDSVIGFNAYTDKTSELFMNYVFTFIRDAIQNSTGGSIQDNINKEYLEGLEFKIPSKHYQDRIVKVLSSIDEKIELNNKMIEKLESLAKTIYDYWFVQFDFPNEHGKPYKSSGGKMIWNEALNMEIPEGWKYGALCKMFDIFDSQRVPLSDNERKTKKGSYPYYGATEIMDYIDEYIFDGTFVLLAEDGSVINSKGNPVLQYVSGKFWVNNHAHILKGANGYSTELLYLILSNVSAVKIMTGSIQKKINQDNLKNYIVPYIPPILAKKLDDYIKNCFQEKLHLRKDIIELVKLREWLLPMLMTGQVTFK